MGFKRHLFAIVIGLVAFLQVAQADEKQHRKLAEEYLKLAEFEKNIVMVLDAQVEMMVKAYPDQYKEYRAALRRTYQRFYSWDKMKPLLVEACMKLFTEDDLKEIIKFIQAPIGQKFLKKMPELAKSNQEISLKLVGGNGEAMQKAFEEEIEKDK